MTELEIKTALNKILMSYADTPHAKESVIKNFITNEGSVKDYVMALADGLKYGNWPWTSYKQVTACIACNGSGLNPYTTNGRCWNCSGGVIE